jgi:hypothetical protein
MKFNSPIGTYFLYLRIKGLKNRLGLLYKVYLFVISGNMKKALKTRRPIFATVAHGSRTSHFVIYMSAAILPLILIFLSVNLRTFSLLN